MKKNQKGFAHVGLVLLVVVVLGVIGFAGYRIFNKKDSADNSTPTAETQTETPEEAQSQPEASQHTELKLASDKVQFEVPKTWIIDKSKCTSPTGIAPACIDGSTLLPPEKMPTIYGGGTEFFTVHVKVYDNKDNKTAKSWFEDVYQGSMPTGSDKTSNEKINGYDTYYYRQINDTYDEITYAYVANGKGVVLVARVSEKGNGASSDFTKYIPDIEKVAKSVKFN